MRESQIDLNDLLYITERRGNPLISYPAPISMYKGEAKINSHVSRFQYLNEKGETEIVDVFHVKPIYYQTVDGFWRPLSEVTSYHGNKRIDLKEGWDQMMDLRFLAWLVKRCELIGGRVSIPMMPTRLMPISLIPKQDHATIYLTTTTYYPDANPETTTVDGYTAHLSANQSWNTFWQAAGDAADDSSSAQEQLMALSDATGTNWKHLFRSIFLFDTSGIGDTDSVTAATLSCWVADHGTATIGDLDVSVVSSNPASNTAISSSDHTSYGSTKYATDVSISSMSNGAYKDWTLNSTGRAAISLTSVTKLGLRWAKDIDSPSTFNSPGSNSSRTFFEGFYAEKTGTSNDPKLAVTYNPIITKTCSETCTFTDTLIRKPVKVILDTVTFTDTVAKTGNYLRILTEIPVFTPSTAFGFLKIKEVSDIVSFLDSLSRVTSRSLAENQTFLDSVSKMQGKTLAETVTFTDSNTFIRAAVRTFLETATFSEIISFYGQYRRTVSEVADFEDLPIFTSGVWTPRTKPTNTWTSVGRPLNYLD